jgi:ubiquinone/menaquinone biosynthesis C-methylase UbiE
MSILSDPNYVAEQYRNASNLNARIQLHARFSTNKYGWLCWVFDRFNIPPENQILELGCGPGNLWLQNRDRIPDGWALTISDISAGMVEEAQRNLEPSQRRFRFEVIDAQSIPFPDDSFDAVIANHMLYHVPDRPKALSEMRRVLRPGGQFYASTVGQTHLQELFVLVQQFDSGIASRDGSPAVSFLLENGSEQLARWFSQVTLHRYEDNLIVTEAAPLVAYVLSSPRAAPPSDRAAEFTAFVEKELDAHGAIHITKDSGLFETC